MTKISWKPGTMISPLPPALISSGDETNKNVMTAAWTGIICSDPVITYVSIRPSRYSHEIIKKNKEFVINLPTWKEAKAVDMVGVKSGKDIDKFELTGLTPIASSKIKAPQIAECPVSMECKVLEVRSFGTHDMFLAEVVAVDVDDKYIEEDGTLNLEKAGLLAYAHGFYYTLGRQIGKFGFSVEKRRKLSVSSSKFSKANNEAEFKKAIEKTVLENGIEVITKKRKFIKKNKANEPKEKSVKRATPKSTDKFRHKDNKSTNYEPYSFRKKSDGSFKKKIKKSA